ncbi:MAG: response regulator [Synechococcales bacterium]|nr:response regulator [Synechococcales bacterium]
MISSQPSQKLHPVGLLALMIRRRVDGCLKVSSEVASWSIYIEQAKLVYATNSITPLDRLHRHLRRLQQNTSPMDVSFQRAQLLFRELEDSTVKNAEYQVICELVDRHYMTPRQAGKLIESIANEVLESFLTLREGSYEVVQDPQFRASPKFCHLDICKVLEMCRRPSPSPMGAGAKSSLIVDSPVSEKGVGRSPNALENSPSIEPVNSPSSSSAHEYGATPPLKKSKYVIVCIDDSPSVLRKIKSFFDEKTFSVLTISDPMNALLQIIRNKPDLILLDVNMPNLNGYELCSLLRRHSNFKKTPVIMVTGKTGFLDRTKAKLIGTSGYLTKPFTKAELIKEVFMHLN